MAAYYNEIDEFAAEWIRRLISIGELPDGEVDQRSIEDVTPQDLKEFTQCHFFAGVGVWAHAFEKAGWGDAPIWSGSAPCQPFSSAGKRKGIKDDRHLWPQWYRLISECRPNTIIGEQVAGHDGLAWFDIVSNDLERENYAVGAVCSNACSFGAPHRRHRLYFVGHASEGRQLEPARKGRRENRKSSSKRSLANAAAQGLEGSEFQSQQNSIDNRASDNSLLGMRNWGKATRTFSSNYWDEAEWLSFRDGKRRPVEPGTFPLVDGVTQIVGPGLRGYGNALCAQQAEAFIRAIMEVLSGS